MSSRCGILALAVVAALPAVALAASPELPRVFLDTTYAPPTGGTVHTVNAGGDVQAALNAAQPGDVVMLENLRFNQAETSKDDMSRGYFADDDELGGGESDEEGGEINRGLLLKFLSSVRS